MELTWHGHSFLELESKDERQILIDPFIQDNPMTERTPGDFEPDLVLVSHGHFDHVADAHKLDATVLCQPEITSYLSEKGHDDCVGFNIGGTYDAEGIEFTMVQAFHSSGTPGEEQDFSGYGGTPSGFIINDGDISIYYSGDTGLFGDMKTVIGEFYSPDIAVLPIGDHYTMGVDEAIQATKWTGVEEVIPIHYDTFPAVEAEPGDFEKSLTKTKVHIPEPGESISF